jgi:hypothetical protein
VWRACEGGGCSDGDRAIGDSDSDDDADNLVMIMQMVRENT